VLADDGSRRPFGGGGDTTSGRTLEARSPRVGRAVEESDGGTMVSVERASSIRRLMRRLVASEAELEAEELQRDAVASGCCPVDEAGRGDLVAISGRLRTVVYTPRTTLPTLEAELYDGSDVVTLVWLGRRHITGIEPGRQLTVRGRVAMRDDRKVMYNPHYDLEPPR
jgi:RecJ-like exonuclease